MRMTWRAAGALAILLMGSQAAMAAPASKTFRDWAVGCDNLNSCTALSLPGEIGDQIAFLKLERPAGADGATRLLVKVRAEKLEDALVVTLALDGAPFPAPGRRWQTKSADGDTAEITLSPADTEALVAAARKATKLTVSVADKILDVSLAGSVAALLWLDEQQGRLNTTSALIRKGAGTAVPAAPPLPVVTAKGTTLPALEPKAVKALTAALRKQVKRLDPDQCEDAPADMTDVDGAWPLAGGARLVGLLCSRGAYNLATGFWIVPGTDVAKARKAQFPQPDGSQDNVLVNADYDPASGQVSFFNKGRGLGDCGVAGGYAWADTGFALTAFSEMGECKGITSDDWLTLFRSEVKVAK